MTHNTAVYEYSSVNVKTRKEVFLRIDSCCSPWDSRRIFSRSISYATARSSLFCDVTQCLNVVSCSRLIPRRCCRCDTVACEFMKMLYDRSHHCCRLNVVALSFALLHPQPGLEEHQQ